MSLVDKINTDFIQAYKLRDEFTSGVLRMIKSSLKNEEIAKKSALSDEEAIKVLKKEAKQRKDSAIEYRNGGKSETAENEEKEASLIETYLPQQLSEEDIRILVTNKIQDLGAASQSDMGKVIGSIMAEHGKVVDGAIVSRLTKELLS